MTKDLIILGSTGSIGASTLNIVRKDKKNFNIRLLTTYKNVRKLYNQAVEFKVREVVIFKKNDYLKFSQKFKNKKIKVFFNLKDVFIKKKK